MKTRIDKFRNWPLTYKLLAGFSIIILLMVLLSGITFRYYLKDKKNNTFAVINQMNIEAIGKVDDYLTDISNVTLLPLYRDSYGDGYYNSFIEELTKFNQTNTSSIELGKLLELLTYNILNYKSSIHSVFIFNLQGKSEYRIIRELSNKDYNPFQEDWFKQCVNSLGNPIYIAPFVLPDISGNQTNDTYVFSVARGIIDIFNPKVIGVFMVNTNVSYLTNICRKMIYTKNQRIMIVDGHGRTVCDTESVSAVHQLDQGLQEALVGLNGAKEVILGKEKFLVSCYPSSLQNLDWRIVNIVPDSELNKQIDNMRLTTVYVTVAIIILAIFIVVMISHQIVKPIRNLVQVMKIVESGDFNVQSENVSQDEIGHMATTFNNMVFRIKKLIEEDYTNKIKQKSLELQMLQSQINPHFLYNALESIHMAAEINFDSEAATMATALGKFLRYSISGKNDIVTVRNELEHLQYYIYLQQVRFEDQFSIKIEIDEQIYEASMVRLILQPVVENAIDHGLKKRGTGGEIVISGCLKDDELIFTVFDNGTGMEPSVVQLMNDYVNGFNDLFSGIGLKNVNKRIKLYYGDAYGLAVASIKGTGTTISITLPYMLSQPQGGTNAQNIPG